jgi:hypothetical protein
MPYPQWLINNCLENDVLVVIFVLVLTLPTCNTMLPLSMHVIDRSKPIKAHSKKISVHLPLGKSTFVGCFKYIDWKQDCTIDIKTIT